MVRGIKEIDHKFFMAYTREGTLDTQRVKAFDCLIDLGALRNQALARYCNGVRGKPKVLEILGANTEVLGAKVAGSKMPGAKPASTTIKDRGDVT
jgi:transcription initiation factor TFIID subunit 2